MCSIDLIIKVVVMSMFKERETEGMPDMMPKGTVDNPPQKEPQNIPDRMVEQPYCENEGEEMKNESEPALQKKDKNGSQSDYECECL